MGNAIMARKSARKTYQVNKISKHVRRASTYAIPFDVANILTTNMQFTGQQIQEAKEAFARYDSSSNGTICTRQLIYVLRSLGQNPTEDDTNEIICEADPQQSGKIEIARFLDMWAKYVGNLDGVIKEAFDIFDRDGSGTISVAEFRAVMTKEGAKMTDTEIDEVIGEMDVDGDGHLNINEFIALMQSA